MFTRRTLSNSFNRYLTSYCKSRGSYSQPLRPTLLKHCYGRRSKTDRHKSSMNRRRLGVGFVCTPCLRRRVLKIKPRSQGPFRATASRVWILITCRKLIQAALLRQDYTAAREAYICSPEFGRDEPITRYMMYKVGLKSGDVEFGRQSAILAVVISSPQQHTSAWMLFVAVPRKTQR